MIESNKQKQNSKKEQKNEKCHLYLLILLVLYVRIELKVIKTNYTRIANSPKFKPNSQRKTELNSTELNWTGSSPVVTACRRFSFNDRHCMDWTIQENVFRLWRTCDDHQFRRRIVASRRRFDAQRETELNWTEQFSWVQFSFPLCIGLNWTPSVNWRAVFSQLHHRSVVTRPNCIFSSFIACRHREARYIVLMLECHIWCVE